MPLITQDTRAKVASPCHCAAEVPRLQNVPLLHFLAAVQAHCDTVAPLMHTSGLGAADLGLAVACAQEAGFVETTGEMHPALRLTAAGRAWAAQELAPFAKLIDPAPAQDARAA